MRVIGTLSLCLSLIALPVWAQAGWGNLDDLLERAMGDGREWAGSYWLPDNTDPALAREAIGVTYPVIEGAAGNTSIAAGYFVRSGNGFAYAGPLDGLFGHDPRDARFLPDRIEVKTTMPRPGEARCCPTGTATWSINRATRQVVRIN
jgi:hypothetical protein